MASPKVEGNRVTIDGFVYEMKPAGANQFQVHDEFGRHLGYFRIDGKRIVVEDYAVEGAHKLSVIRGLWGPAYFALGGPAPALVTKGVCRIASHEAPSDDALASARLHLAWQKKQQGVKSCWLVRDPETGKAKTFTVFQNRAALQRIDEATDRDGVPLEAATVEVFPFVEEP
jgi:hypothetical protein